MAKKQETTTMEIVPNTGELTSPLVIPTDDIEEAVVMEEEIDPNNHPNFIESNTAAISLAWIIHSTKKENAFLAQVQENL